MVTREEELLTAQGGQAGETGAANKEIREVNTKLAAQEGPGGANGQDRGQGAG